MSKTPSPLSAAPNAKAISGLAWLGSSPLLPGEVAADYDRLRAHVSAAVRPTDALEEIWLRDIVDLTWDVVRWRRLKDSLIVAHIPEGLTRILSIGLGFSAAEALAKSWAARDPQAIQKVAQLLASAGLTIDAAVAETLLRLIDPIERIVRLIMTAETRRNNALREIDRHRAAFASAAQRALHDVEDAVFHDVKPNTIAPKSIGEGNTA